MSVQNQPHPSHIPAATRPELLEAMRDRASEQLDHVRHLASRLAGRMPAAYTHQIYELVNAARALGAAVFQLDLIEQGQLIADADDVDVVFYGADAVLEFGVDDGGSADG